MIIHTTHTDYHMLSMPYANSHVRFYVDNFFFSMSRRWKRVTDSLI